MTNEERKARQYKVGDRVRAKRTGWTGTVTKVGTVTQWGERGGVRVRWDNNGVETRTRAGEVERA